jgi:hypothetical protein
MTYTRSQCLILVAIALVVAGLLHVDVIVNHFHKSSDKVGVLIASPRTDVGDNYFYYILLKHAPERFQQNLKRTEDPDGGDLRIANALSNSYATALLAGHMIYRLAQSLTSTSRATVLVSSILLSTVFALCFAFYVLTLLDKRELGEPFPIFVLMTIGLMFIGFFAVGLHFGKFVWSDAVLNSYTTRILNPPLLWSIGLIAAATIIRWIRDQRLTNFIFAVLLAGLVGLFNISLGAALAFSLGICMILDYLSTQQFPKKITVIFVSSLAGLAWNYFCFQLYRSSSLGQELRHGDFESLDFTWAHLLTIVLIPYLWRTLEKERNFVIALLISSIVIGMVCESFHLGSRIWLRGAVIFEWGIIVSLMFRLSIIWIVPGCKNLLGNVLPQILFLFVSAGLFIFLQQPNANSWHGFIEREKWDMYNWIDTHLPPDSIVVSSDIEDAFLLPIYSSSKSLYAMKGLTNQTRDEAIKRYLYNMALFDKKEKIIDQFSKLSQHDMNNYIEFVYGEPQKPYKHETAEVIIFLRQVIYYQNSKSFSTMLINLNQRHQFEKILQEKSEEIEYLKYSFNYAILPINTLVPHTFIDWDVAYQNKQYLLFKNPELPHFPGVF